MDPHIKAQESDFDDSSVGPLDHVPRSIHVDRPTSKVGGILDDERKSNASQNDSVTTATEDHHAAASMKSMDRIEVAPNGESHGVDSHTLDFADTIKEAAYSAKKKLYIHHRHDRKLSKQFTPGTMAKHMGSAHQSTSKEPEPLRNPGAQTVDNDHNVPSSTFGQNLLIMLTTFPYWNMAFWSGWCYSIGSALFIIDGLWAWLPLASPDTEFKGESKWGVPLLFFFGACLYQVGGVMAYLEAINDGSFAGAAMKRLLEGHQDLEKELLDAKLHTFFGHIVPHHHHEDAHDDCHHGNQPEDPEAGWKALTQSRTPENLYVETKQKVERRAGVDEGLPKEGEITEYIAWRWWPTWHALRTYHIFELGYVSCSIQLFGVTLYGVTSVVVLPGILDTLAPWQTLAAYWIPQVVASCCFLWASIMFTVMAQDKWYKPKFREVSWWIGIWAQIGSVGFLMGAVFGLHSDTHTWALYQSSLSSMWGSIFYMLSGLFQWYEAINVNVGPVLAFPNNRTPVLLRKHAS